jgi:hypothetical protein
MLSRSDLNRQEREKGNIEAVGSFTYLETKLT